MKEEFRDIVDSEGLYQVSNLGRVKSLCFREPKILKPIIIKGYLCVCINGELKSIHRLMAQVFLPNPENKPEVNHKDGNKENNVINLDDLYGEKTNLEWCTRSENMIHAYNKGLSKKNKKVTQYNLKGEQIKTYISCSQASKENDIPKSHICKCALGRYGFKTAGGYIWKYDCR